MASSVRLLVVDLDGTLVGSAGEPTPRVRDAVARAGDHGVQVSLCTGRPMASCGSIARSLGLPGPHVAFNGALVKVLDSPNVVFRQPLPPETVDRLIDLGRREEVCLELYTETTHYVEREWRESRLHAISIRVGYDIASFDSFRGRSDIVKAQIITSDERSREATRRIADAFSGVLRFSIAIPMAPCEGMECVNVVEQSVSKGTAVQALLAYHGFDREQVAGAGDALNDLPMLEQVGYRIAMGNAEPEIKALANVVVASVDDDGLAEGIDLILEG